MGPCGNFKCVMVGACVLCEIESNFRRWEPSQIFTMWWLSTKCPSICPEVATNITFKCNQKACVVLNELYFVLCIILLQIACGIGGLHILLLNYALLCNYLQVTVLLKECQDIQLRCGSSLPNVNNGAFSGSIGSVLSNVEHNMKDNVSLILFLLFYLFLSLHHIAVLSYHIIMLSRCLLKISMGQFSKMFNFEIKFTCSQLILAKKTWNYG